jgi:hypothetical protein
VTLLNAVVAIGAILVVLTIVLVVRRNAKDFRKPGSD